MLATIATPVFDFSGHVEINMEPDYVDEGVRRRVNRVATLDGSAVVNDGGFSHADRTITLRWKPTSTAFEANVERLVRLYSTLHTSTPAGVFLAAPETYTPGKDESTLRLLVLEKLSA